jgi:hypothetical protein
MAPAFAFNLNLRTAFVNLSILIPAYNPGPAFSGLVRALASDPEHDLFNYNVVPWAVFQTRQPHQFTFLKYVLLVAVNGAISYAFLNLLMSRFLLVPLPAKLISEGILKAS